MGRGTNSASKRPVRAAAMQSQNSQNNAKSTAKPKPKVDKPADKSNAKKNVGPVVPPSEPVETADSDTPVEESAQTPKTV